MDLDWAAAIVSDGQIRNYNTLLGLVLVELDDQKYTLVEMTSTYT